MGYIPSLNGIFFRESDYNPWQSIKNWGGLFSDKPIYIYNIISTIYIYIYIYILFIYIYIIYIYILFIYIYLFIYLYLFIFILYIRIWYYIYVNMYVCSSFIYSIGKQITMQKRLSHRSSQQLSDPFWDDNSFASQEFRCWSRNLIVSFQTPRS